MLKSNQCNLLIRISTKLLIIMQVMLMVRHVNMEHIFAVFITMIENSISFLICNLFLCRQQGNIIIYYIYVHTYYCCCVSTYIIILCIAGYACIIRIPLTIFICYSSISSIWSSPYTSSSINHKGI